MKLAFITAIYGEYEKSCKKFKKQTIDTDFICFTDNKNITNNGWIIDNTPYHIINKSKIDTKNKYNSLNKNKHTFNIAKYYKQNFHNIPILKKYDYIIWIDGTIEIINENISQYIINNMNDKLLMTWTHEFRKGILLNEVLASDFERYTSCYWNQQHQPYQNIYKQFIIYKINGYNDEYWNNHKHYNNFYNTNVGVWITCFIVFNNKHPNLINFLDNWYLQTLEFTTQDQISFPYICFKLNNIPLSLPNNIIKGDNPHQKTDFYIKHTHGL